MHPDPQPPAPDSVRTSPSALFDLWRSGRRLEADRLAARDGFQIVLEGANVRIRDLLRPDAPRAVAEVPANRRALRAAKRAARR